LSLRDRLKETTTQAILDAAETELAEEGFAATAMSSIAKRAGVSVGTLYNYFEDKDKLLASLIGDRRERFSGLLDDALAAHKSLPFEIQLEGVVKAVLRIFEAHRNYLRVVWESRITDAAGKSGERLLIERLSPLVAQGVAAGILNSDDADLYAVTLAALIRGVVRERLDDRKHALSDATSFVLRMFLHGAC